MHEPIKENLESYLSEKGSATEVSTHLAACPECREEVRQMREQAVFLRALRAPVEAEPRAGFYARVLERIEAQRAKATFWSGFLEPVFAKRLAFASLTLVLLLGSVLAVIQNDGITSDMAADHPEVMMTERAIPAAATENVEQERNAVLVNLTTYSEPVSGGIQ